MILVIKHVCIEGPGIIGDFFQNFKWQVRTIELEKGDKFPSYLTDIEATIILGGPMNVYAEDKFPFLKDEDAFIKKAIKKEIPILGICLGAQLLAKATGARVRKAEQEEIGWGKVELTEKGEKDILFQGGDRVLDVFQWHQDTFEIPSEAVLLATTDTCQNQAFRYGQNAYGLQFHIEVTPSMIESWIRKYINSNSQNELVAPQRMLTVAYKQKEQFVKQADKIFSNFSRLITEKITVAG